MKLSAWAKSQGISYRTAWNWVKQNRMPVPFTRTPSGTILVEEKPTIDPSIPRVALYARVSSADQRADLERQLARLVMYANSAGLYVARSITEIGSAMNARRPHLLKLLKDSSVTIIIVEHRDRLMRFGFEYVEAALWSQGRSILVLDEVEVEDDLVRDMTEVLISFSARLYGRRSAKNRERGSETADDKNNEDTPPGP